MYIFKKLNNSLYVKDIFHGLKRTINKPNILCTNLVKFIQKYIGKDKKEIAAVISAFVSIILNNFNVISFDDIVYKLVCELLSMYDDVKFSKVIVYSNGSDFR
ncbi:MAG: hypothetical protein LBL77_00645 [Endomicrobium sp.]|jgi:chromate transport protein ChrA|nr:hypothetical protein [Endomicrobium sp.]